MMQIKISVGYFTIIKFTGKFAVFTAMMSTKFIKL